MLQWGELHGVQRVLREGLSALRRDGNWKYTAGEVDYLLQTGGRELFAARNPLDTYVLNAMAALAAVGDRLRFCREEACGRPFIAVKRQQFCAACAEARRRARVQAWRRRNRERLHELAHEAYVKRKRRETGRPRLKIERRPRVGREKAAR